jgi:hypothetical protein
MEIKMFNNKKYPYKVTVHIDGRHPYLESNELDTESKDVIMTVPARNWKEAEKLALSASTSIRGWRYNVSKIEKDW